MCFFYALSKTAQSLANRYQLGDGLDWPMEAGLSAPKYYVSGFDFPKMPVLTNAEPARLLSLGIDPVLGQNTGPGGPDTE
jgi:hypothetical protein